MSGSPSPRLPARRVRQTAYVPLPSPLLSVCEISLSLSLSWLAQWFDEHQQNYEALDIHLKKLHQAIEGMISSRKGHSHT